MIAKVTLYFWYDDKYVPPHLWDWSALTDTKERVKVLDYKYYHGFPCYFCNDPILEDDIVWINIANGTAEGPPDGQPFHIGCAPEDRHD